MSGDRVVRIAARGDGVTESGKYVGLAAPGDMVAEDGSIVRGPGYLEPPCRHFPTCGGCQLQHLTDEAYATYCEDRVAGALAQKGIETAIRPAIISPPNSRRRASLRAMRAKGRVLLGFNEEKSKRIVDMRECHVLRPELFALMKSLRALLDKMLPDRGSGEVVMTRADQGIDLLLKGVEVEGLEATMALTDFAETHRLARLSVDEGYGAEVRYEPRPAAVTLSGKAVPLPVGAFLQASEQGEAALVAAVREIVGNTESKLDLFAGIGTFALAVKGDVSAAEASRDAVLALKQAAPQMSVEHRDLYRRPYDMSELGGVDAVIIDPPRAGAEEQAKQLASSAVPTIAHVSCNPGTFARDAAILVEGGYSLEWVQPVGQFLWSSHVELAACFTRHM